MPQAVVAFNRHALLKCAYHHLGGPLEYVLNFGVRTGNPSEHEPVRLSKALHVYFQHYARHREEGLSKPEAESHALQDAIETFIEQFYVHNSS